MTTGSSTIGAVTGSTVKPTSSNAGGADLQHIIESDWQTGGNADLVAVLRELPDILRDKSLLLNLAVREFQARNRAVGIDDLANHCQRFREFGSAIERSIFRQLDVHRLVDGCFSSSDDAEPDWPTVGERFGKFHVLEMLGVGSMARVYLCLETDVGNRQVVVKVSPHASIEASILGKLSHPNITPIYSTDYVEQSALYYLCMPYCGRSTLTDLIDLAHASGQPHESDVIRAAARWGDEKPSARRAWYRHFSGVTYVDRVLDLAIQLAGALAYAHSHRITHGDLKPSNVLLSPEGRALLLDFNLSQDYTNFVQRCGGTLPYMPPEQLQLVAEGGARNFDQKFNPSPDIFSFGALIYELLYGVTPLIIPKECVDTKQIAELFIEQYRKGVRFSPPLGNISQRLASLIQSCLTFDIHQRPATMADVQHVLKTERAWIPTLRRRARARPVAARVITAVALASISISAIFLAMQPPKQLRAYTAAVAAEASGDLATAISNFDDALSIDAEFRDARFARGRAHLHSKNLDFAMNDFWRLTRAGDAKAMAMLAYCFNMQNVKVAAVLWYKKALDRGVASSAIDNNLGACYLVTQTHLNQQQALSAAELHLKRALATDGDSPIIRMNYVRFITTKALTDPSYDPSGAWRLAYSILNAEPDDRLIRTHVGEWYIALRDYASRAGKTKLTESFGIDSEAEIAFEAAMENHFPSPKRQKRQFGREELPTLERGYFLEPFQQEYSR